MEERPARFPVGMKRSLFPPDSAAVHGTPLSVAAYLGRIEEVTDDGAVTVTLWERPNGREGLTVLSTHEHFPDKEPSTGDLLWIWTWIDVSREHGREKRIYMELESRILDDDDRVRLRDLLADLATGAKE
jgi:hypothetical protein